MPSLKPYRLQLLRSVASAHSSLKLETRNPPTDCNYCVLWLLLTQVLNLKLETPLQIAIIAFCGFCTRKS